MLVSLSLLTVLPSQAQTNLPPAGSTNRPAPERFLVIYDISNGMEKRAANSQRVIGQMFASGLNGELERGDQIGAWAFNNELHTGQFQLQRWTPQVGPTIAATLAKFVERQRYSKSPAFAPVMAQLTNVVADSDKITVIFVSDGSTAPIGTMFDDQIAEAFKLNAAEQRRLAMPFVTILRAAKGKFVSLRVNTPPWPIELPAYPSDQKIAPPPAKTATPPPAPAVVPVAPEPIRTTQTNLAATTTTNAPVVEASPPPLPEPTNLPPVVATLPTQPPSNPPLAQLEKTNPTPAVAAAPPTAAPAATPKARKLPLISIIAGACVVLGGIAILCFALLKRSREEPRVSLITRSMNKDRK